MISFQGIPILSKEEIDYIWNAVHSLWSNGFLAESSGKMSVIQKLQFCQDGEVLRPIDQEFLAVLDELAQEFLADDSWLLFDYDIDAETRQINSLQFEEIDMSGELMLRVQKQIRKLGRAQEDAVE